MSRGREEDIVRFVVLVEQVTGGKVSAGEIIELLDIARKLHRLDVRQGQSPAPRKLANGYYNRRVKLIDAALRIVGNHGGKVEHTPNLPLRIVLGGHSVSVPV